MKHTRSLIVIVLFLCMGCTNKPQDFIGKNEIKLQGDTLTAEALWAMGRISNYQISPDGKTALYGVRYYSVPQNKSHAVIYVQDLNTLDVHLLTNSNANETSASFIEGGKRILFLSNQDKTNQLWTMDTQGKSRQQISMGEEDIEDYLLAPNESHIILIRQVTDSSSIAPKYEDLPDAQGMVINDLMYKHWDHFVTSIPHPFVADFSLKGILNEKDILEGEPYECPMLPFGGVEQLAWSPDSKTIAYTCRKKTGKAYATSTDSDIFLYDIEQSKTQNLCKPEGYVSPEPVDLTRSFQHQAVNRQDSDYNVGYDTNPKFSPDGKYVAWLSMEREGYESDRNRLCIFNLSTQEKHYATEEFESGVDSYCWSKDSKTLYFTGVWHGTAMAYSVNVSGENLQKLTEGVWDYAIQNLSPSGQDLILSGHSMSQADEIYQLNIKNKEICQLTFENEHIYKQLTMGNVEERWIPTTDGKQMQTWIIYPPHFDPQKKYPTLLYCEGGPQSPVSQFWSYRWNFQIMAAHGYIVVAPNRRGLPGYGMEWLEQISGDYAGQCMKDYLSAIDNMSTLSFVDKDKQGCVGASFGGYSVYWLAGHHQKRFKCFIAHDGIFNTHAQYGETEEMWFANWDLTGAPWNNSTNNAFQDSPHLSVGQWDTPILCIHGMKDYRILHSQGEAAFTEATLRGVPAQLLLFPDENHWVLKPQNGILWQRTFFNWLDKWLK